MCAPARVVAHVGGKTQRVVGLDRVVALVLQRVGADLVEQADAAALVEHVDQHAAPGLLDLVHRRFELFAAVAALGAEHVAGQALRMQAHQHRLVRLDLAFDQRDEQRWFPGCRL